MQTSDLSASPNAKLLLRQRVNRLCQRLPLAMAIFRWVICTLLLFGTTKNYMDRNVSRSAQQDAPTRSRLERKLTTAILWLSFQAAYATGDGSGSAGSSTKLGTRLGYALAMVFWSLASMGTALGSFPHELCFSREFALGFGEAAIFSRQH